MTDIEYSKCKTFMVELLFKDYIEKPDEDFLKKVFSNYFGQVSYHNYNDGEYLLSIDKYKVNFSCGFVSPQLLFKNCEEVCMDSFNEAIYQQTWDCSEETRDEIKSCKYSLKVSEFMGQGLCLNDRLDLLMDALEALVDVFPTCVAVYFPSCDKLVPCEKIRNHSIEREYRFAYFCVNVRVFANEGFDSFTVDSLGLGLLDFPDVQYKVTNASHEVIVMHAYNLCAHIIKTNNSLNNADTVDGADENGMNPNKRWLCQYKKSIMEPKRTVIEISVD